MSTETSDPGITHTRSTHISSTARVTAHAANESRKPLPAIIHLALHGHYTLYARRYCKA
ncbi:hypothetical protein [Streptomyces roseifaciens]|uniref:hypothetical protein n=1 Tax=Streptomyces roseifaciens TaxID=1488406 RepID=UPI001FE1D08F|nr:hypothetical protein [Streptomyces roseifaciens]